MGENHIDERVAHVPCYIHSQSSKTSTSAKVPREKELRIKVNGKEIVNLLCSPEKEDYLVYGFLYGLKIISNTSDIERMDWNDDRREVNVKIPKETVIDTKDRYIPTGLGGGFVQKKGTFRIESDLKISSALILDLIRDFNDYLEKREARGIHTSSLASQEGLLIVTDDIGRHNTIDKIMGEALVRKIETKDKILITTGRISSEMVYKTGSIGVPILISRRSPTDNSISLGSEMGVTIIGLATPERFGVFSCPERVFD